MEILIAIRGILVIVTLAAVVVIAIAAVVKALGTFFRNPGKGVLAIAGLCIVTVAFAGFGFNAMLSGVTNLNTVINRHAKVQPSEASLQQVNNHGKHHVR